MKWLIVFFIAMTLAVAVPRRIAVDRAVTHETSSSSSVTYQCGGELVSSYLALPDGGTPPFPALLVIHDDSGLDDRIKSHARRLAVTDDCVVLAVDLYRGKVDTSDEGAERLVAGLSRDRAMEDLAGAIDYLKSRQDVDPTRIGVIGWGTGADLALATAPHRTDLRAVVICDRLTVPEEADVWQMDTPILGVFGGAEPGFPVSSILEFQRSLSGLGKDAEMVIYPHAMRGFMDSDNEAASSQGDATKAWGRISAFLAAAFETQ